MALVLAMSANLVVPSVASGFLRAGSVSELDAASTLASELAGGQGARLSALEDALRSTFAALPKDSAGELGHQAVRYALHRLFVQQRGWYIKGLEPGADSANASEWVPSFLQSRLEQLSPGRGGASLRELAALAAALEDLVAKETSDHIAKVYGMLGRSVAANLGKEEVLEIIYTYYAGFLDGGDLSAGNPEEARRELQSFITNYVGWAEAEGWLLDTLAPHFASGAGAYSFDQVVQMAKEIGEHYYTLNDAECRSLKGTMGELEGRRAGRVRLPAFYKKGLYSHWQFDERPEYLRAVGALDESEPGSSAVILPNYLSARTNCLEASSLYALCCRNECEDLLGHLERQVGAPQAPELEVARLVAALPSDTVEAPRFLSSALLGRLSEIAACNGGLVPLHGRLFAQWMHHAFPRECPYPHEAGTTSPQTPDEWMQRSGQETHKLSRDEMQRHVEEDTCSFEPEFGPAAGCGGGDSEELPWSGAEELLDEPRELGRGAALLPWVLALCSPVAAVLLRRPWGAAGLEKKPASGSLCSDLCMSIDKYA
jgi:hypothetical protein